jgi:hypothetical protein
MVLKGVRHCSPRAVEDTDVVARVHAINARWAEPASKSLKWPHCTGHTFAVSDAALSAHFNLQDRLGQIPVVNDRDIPELNPPCLVGPQSGIDCKEHIVVKLFGFPLGAFFLWLLREFSCCLVEFLVFIGREPRSMGDLGDDRYGSEKSGRRSSHPWRSAVFRVWRSVTIS